jgi:hypothetical protein
MVVIIKELFVFSEILCRIKEPEQWLIHLDSYISSQYATHNHVSMNNSMAEPCVVIAMAFSELIYKTVDKGASNVVRGRPAGQPRGSPVIV